MGDSSLDYWRKLFHSIGSDIFELIEKAIFVAAVDCPKELKDKRVQIAEKLFKSRFSKSSTCNNVELQVNECTSVKRELGEKDSRNCGLEDVSRFGVSVYSYDKAETLTHVIDEEGMIVGEVLKIKEILCNKEEKSDTVLYESLKRLQLMQLSIESLKATEVVRAVNGLRKHNSKHIRTLVRTLIDGWKVLADEWIKATSAINEHSPVNTFVKCEQEGLPSPPMDEEALLFTQTNIQLSEVLDGIDEDGRRVASKSHGPLKRQEPQMKKQEEVFRQEKPLLVSGMLPKPHRVIIRLKKPSTVDSRIVRPSNPASEQRTSSQISGVSQNKSNHLQDMTLKLEKAKRKLHEGYQQIENAKKQRKIQILELHDLPKQLHNQRPPNMKPWNQSKSWAMAKARL